MVRMLCKRTPASLDEPRAYLFRSVLNESRGVLSQRRSMALPSRHPSVSMSEPDRAVVGAVAALPALQRAAMFLRCREHPTFEYASRKHHRVAKSCQPLVWQCVTGND